MTEIKVQKGLNVVENKDYPVCETMKSTELMPFLQFKMEKSGLQNHDLKKCVCFLCALYSLYPLCHSPSACASMNEMTW